MSGYAPSKLAEFPNLTVLNLSHNALSGGATELLENGYEGSDGSDELITIDLSNNPWTYEPDQYQSYWKEFEAEVTRGFVDLTTTVLQKRYPILSVNDRTSLMGYLNKRAQGETRQAIKARAIEHIAKKGAWKTSATLLVKGMTLVGTVGSGIGWVVFTIEVANILHGVLDAAVEVLQRGPGTLIKETSDSVLGIYDACLLGKGYYDAPTKTSEQKAAIEAECKNR